jgi:retinol-binding protein 3
MFRRRVHALTLVALLAPLAIPAQAPTIPDTPVGAVLRVWFDAFASGDTNRILDFYHRYQPDRVMLGPVSSRLGMGGFELVSVEKSEPRHIEIVVKEKRTQRLAYGTMDLAPTDPARIASSVMSPMPPNASLADLSIDAAGRATVIAGASAQLDSFYVFPDVAKRVGDSLRVRNKRGAYDAYTKKMTFAAKLNDDVRELSRDKHMGFNYTFRPFTPRPAGQTPFVPSADDLARARDQAGLVNCEFVKVERLDGNIGYVKFDAFLNVDLCGATASAAMNFVAGTRALIVDMRENGGGSPEMVSYVSSYLFSKRTHLNDLWDRRNGQTDEFWTRDDVPGRRFGGEKPVYVLTSANTFSGGEEFTYNLKALKRATIVGEVTGGGAHPVGPRPVGDSYVMAVPFARAINPITHTNWEGVGVEPDIKVPAGDALATALKRLRDAPRP